MNNYSVESLDGDTNKHSVDCKIKVLGVGGGGGNMLQYMINQSLQDVEFIAINTDAQALNRSTAPLKVQIGVKLTNGLGAGCDPNKGRLAAEESREDIKKLLQGAKMVFITAGLGGGTGTGAAPVIAQIAKEVEALTVGVVTKPFAFEGKLHRVNAEVSISELYKHVDSLIIVDNNKLIGSLGANVSLVNAFNAANDVLLNAVRGITDTISSHNFINVDFADVRTIMSNRGLAMIGTGTGQGANFIEDAIHRSIHSPLLDQVDVSRATGLIVSARVNPNFPINKWSQINDELQHYLDEDADCKFGLTYDDSLSEEQIMITVLITGISSAPIGGQAAANARSNINARRNASLPNNNGGGFYNMAQQSQLGTSSPRTQSRGNQNAGQNGYPYSPQQQPQPQVASYENQQVARQQAAMGSPVAPGTRPVYNNQSYSNESYAGQGRDNLGAQSQPQVVNGYNPMPNSSNSRNGTDDVDIDGLPSIMRNKV